MSTVYNEPILPRQSRLLDCSFTLVGIVGRARYFPNQIPALNPACTRPRWRNDAVFPRQIHFIPSQSSITPADESANYSQVWLLFRGQSIAKPCAEYQGLD